MCALVKEESFFTHQHDDESSCDFIHKEMSVLGEKFIAA